MLSFYLICNLFYFFLLWRMSLTWPKERGEVKHPNQLLPATLVIALRNEARNLPSLILSIKRSLSSLKEVILVDDHSEDGTFLKLEQQFFNSELVKVVASPRIGKKAAINHAISLASGEIVLTSDADCVWEKTWPEVILTSFENPQIQLVTGPILPQNRSGFLTGFQLMEWVSTLLVTNYSFAIGKALTCSAANMAFRKSAFHQVHGFEGNEINPSGDDEFLLKKIKREYGETAVKYLPIKETLIQTVPESSWSALIHQKIRWAGKWKSHSSLLHSLVAAIPALFQVIWLSSLVMLFWGKIEFLGFCSIWIFKILAEIVAFVRILRSLGKPFKLPVLMGTSFIHPFYVILVVLGVIRGKYVWKDRVTKRSD
ncbi:glycosyltransferase [Algoriphagus lutimaris]|uniref:glycosyltransferase n=1 Tax=Algoriphagus lutimaris TaxID=613197 RepID=UPI00196A648D|nr:glycosyltransferase [Algoriphagus lutimaris]MBN3522100.1 glycosyltransferase [Algoriphagus lutimaris]